MSPPCFPKDQTSPFSLNNRLPHETPFFKGPDNSNNDDMRWEINRLRSFKNWPCKFLKPEEMAKCGFYFTGRNDYVKCAFCMREIGEWEEGDDPMYDHHRWTYGNCPFLKNMPCGNVPIGSAPTPIVYQGYDTCGKYGIEMRPNSIPECYTEPNNSQNNFPRNLTINMSQGPAYPQYAVYEKRLESYVDWPPSISQKPEQLAEAGFFYNQKGDQTICFYCGGGLKDWVAEDDPWEQHARWFSKCSFLRLKKSEEYVSEVCNRLNAIITPQEARELQMVEMKEAQKSAANEDSSSAGNLEAAAPSSSLLPSPQLSISSEEKTEKHTKELNTESKETSNTRTICKICYTKEVGVVFLPCGHIIACVDCASALRTCAVCRKPLEASVRAFLS